MIKCTSRKKAGFPKINKNRSCRCNLVSFLGRDVRLVDQCNNLDSLKTINSHIKNASNHQHLKKQFQGTTTYPLDQFSIAEHRFTVSYMMAKHTRFHYFLIGKRHLTWKSKRKPQRHTTRCLIYAKYTLIDATGVRDSVILSISIK